MAFESYLLLLPSVAGGHFIVPDEAREAAAKLKLAAWILGATNGGDTRGRKARYRRCVEVTLRWAAGAPDPATLRRALEVAGERHDVVYLLRTRRRPAPREADHSPPATGWTHEAIPVTRQPPPCWPYRRAWDQTPPVP